MSDVSGDDEAGFDVFTAALAAQSLAELRRIGYSPLRYMIDRVSDEQLEDIIRAWVDRENAKAADKH